MLQVDLLHARFFPHIKPCIATLAKRMMICVHKDGGRRCMRAHKCLMSRMHPYRRSICEVEMQYIVMILHQHRLVILVNCLFHYHLQCVFYNYTLDACALATPRVVPLSSHQNRAMLVM
jgi:hypothetical protein